MLVHLHKDKKGSLLLILKGGSSSTHLLEQALRDVPPETLFTLSAQPYQELFTHTKHNSYYNSGFYTLEQCIKEIIREKCRYSVAAGLDYLKWGMQRKATALKADPVDILREDVLRENLITQAATHALESSPWHVNSFLYCMDRSYIQRYLPLDLKRKCLDTVYQEVALEDMATYTVDNMLNHLIQDKSLLPDWILEYGLARAKKEASSEVERLTLEELGKLLPSKKVTSII